MDSQSPNNGDSSTAKRKSVGKARQNLTDEQKRQNHIISEQKRRNVIRQGYADLDALVPILNGGKSGLSKADQIKEIVAYVDATVKGNASLQNYLQSMNRQRDYDDADDGAGFGGLAGGYAY
jgi:hypothetical protein